jgi:hypothetical protein
MGDPQRTSDDFVFNDTAPAGLARSLYGCVDEDALIRELDFRRASARLEQGLDPLTGRPYDRCVDPFATTWDLEPVEDELS